MKKKMQSKKSKKKIFVEKLWECENKNQNNHQKNV